MAYISVETLTPVHVGSGRIYKDPLDCLNFKDENVWAILDERKALSILDKEGISQWVSCIENGTSVLELLQKRKPGLKAVEIAKRVLKKANSSYDAMTTHEIREQIHTHNLIPYIPGSSIKGSLRTAIFTSLLKTKTDTNAGYLTINRIQNNNSKLTDQDLSKDLLGKDPNHDPLRFLQISDIHFNHTEAWVTGSYNNSYWEKKRFKQWTEAIPPNSKSFGILRVEGTRKSAIGLNSKTDFNFKHTNILSTHQDLFSCINAYTLNQLKKEILWAEKKGNLDESPSTEIYLSELNTLKTIIEKLDSHSCILRVGYGIGLNNMTGGWQTDLLTSDIYKQWKFKIIKSPAYADLEYPKTRRMLEGGLPLGFIKISLLHKDEIPDLSVSEKLSKINSDAQIISEAAPLAPEYVNGPFRQGADIPAQCIGPGSSSQNQYRMKLLIGTPGNEPILECRYPSELNEMSYHWVTIKEVKKDKHTIQSISYKKQW